MTGQPEMDWQRDLRKAFAGFSEVFAQANARMEAHKLREGEDGYLAYATAWECARVEYVWRMRHSAAVTGRLRWKDFCKAARSDLKEEAAARLTAEGDRDTYKARWEERTRHLEQAAAETDAMGNACRDLLRERNEAIECSEILRGELARSRAEHAVDVETLRRERARADRIRDANLRLCALREADRTGKDADDVLTAEADFETTGALVPRQEAKTVWDVVEGGKVIGVVRDNGHRTYNAYVGTAETFVGVYRHADQAARAVRASAGPTEPQDTGDVLITPREGSEIWNVDRPGENGGIGYLSPSSAGWNAYVYQSIGRAKFVGWYDDADKGAAVIDRRYGR